MMVTSNQNELPWVNVIGRDEIQHQSMVKLGDLFDHGNSSLCSVYFLVNSQCAAPFHDWCRSLEENGTETYIKDLLFCWQYGHPIKVFAL